MKWLLVLGAALCVAACGSEVEQSEGPPQPGIREDGTVDPALCQSGAYDANGNPVVTGDPCYDEWAAGIAGTLAEVEASMADYRDRCAALALAYGEPDSWSDEATVTEQALAACNAARMGELPGDVMCSVTVEECDATLTCETDTSPPPLDLDTFEQAGGDMIALCCTAEMDLLNPQDFLPPTLCAPAPGTEACLVDLFAVDGLQSFGEVIAAACSNGGVSGVEPASP